MQTAIIIRFRKPSDWADSVYVHYWNTHPPGGGSIWPGVPMQKVDGWMVHRFEGIEAASFVFNDARGRQTSDLHRERSGWYDLNSRWHDQEPQSAAPSPSTSRTTPPGFMSSMARVRSARTVSICADDHGARATPIDDSRRRHDRFPHP